MTSDRIPPYVPTLLAQVGVSGLDAPIFDATDGRWDRLRSSYPSGLDLRDRFRGALIGGAIGDAMGRPNEGRTTEVARERKIREYQPWHGWAGGPTGTITDDTQITMWVAEAILASGERAAGDAGQRTGEPQSHRCQRAENQETVATGQTSGDAEEWGVVDLRDRVLDPEDLARRFTSQPIRGIGKGTREFVRNSKDLGKPWHEAGVRSAGNGTAMRAAPVGLVHLGDPYRIYRDSLLQSVVTHRDSMAIAAAACQAYAVARAAAAAPNSLAPLANRVAFCAELALLLEGLEKPGYQLDGSTGAASLHGRIGIELPRLLTTGETPFATWHNGAYVLGSFPCAVWCFLASPDDFEQTLFTTVDAGHDADTVAAIACTLSGAYHGYSRLPQRLLADLEYHDHLLGLADGLYELNRRL